MATPVESDPRFRNQHLRLVEKEERILKIAARIVRQVKEESKNGSRAIITTLKAAVQHSRTADGGGDTIRVVGVSLGLTDTQEVKLRKILSGDGDADICSRSNHAERNGKSKQIT